MTRHRKQNRKIVARGATEIATMIIPTLQQYCLLQWKR